MLTWLRCAVRCCATCTVLRHVVVLQVEAQNCITNHTPNTSASQPAGTPEAPRCGFSQRSVAALQDSKEPFKSFDILTDEAVRQGLKKMFDWPTFPQLYVNGELLGGCDIITDLAGSHELQDTIQEMRERMVS